MSQNPYYSNPNAVAPAQITNRLDTWGTTVQMQTTTPNAFEPPPLQASLCWS